jgi:hypothetical protein
MKYKKKLSLSQDKWFYIGIIVEDLANSLLEDIISERFINNFDKNSPYYDKNNRIIHWIEINDATLKIFAKDGLITSLMFLKVRKNFILIFWV